MNRLFIAKAKIAIIQKAPVKKLSKIISKKFILSILIILFIFDLK